MVDILVQGPVDATDRKRVRGITSAAAREVHQSKALQHSSTVYSSTQPK